MAASAENRLVAGDIWEDKSMGHRWKITGLDFAGQGHVHFEQVGAGAGRNPTTQQIPFKTLTRDFTFRQRGRR